MTTLCTICAVELTASNTADSLLDLCVTCHGILYKSADKWKFHDAQNSEKALAALKKSE